MKFSTLYSRFSKSNARSYQSTYARGFSLTELLIVIGIISIFVSFILASTSGARERSRDARRYADLSQLGQALEAYYLINNTYPSTFSEWRTVCTNGLNTTPYDITGSNGYIPDLAPGFIGSLPVDPVGCAGSGKYHGYVYKSDGKNYKLATDWSAEIGLECSDGKQFYDAMHTDSNKAWCAIYTHGANDWYP